MLINNAAANTDNKFFTRRATQQREQSLPNDYLSNTSFNFNAGLVQAARIYQNHLNVGLPNHTVSSGVRKQAGKVKNKFFSANRAVTSNARDSHELVEELKASYVAPSSGSITPTLTPRHLGN